MALATRRTFRLSLTVALSLVCGYAFQLQIPYIVPMFAILLTAKPAPPPSPIKLITLLVGVSGILGVGMLLIPWMEFYPFAAVMVVGLGIFGSFCLSLLKGNEALGHFLATGLVLVTVAGSVSSVISLVVIESMVLGVGFAVLCQWVVYPFFSEDAHLGDEEHRHASPKLTGLWPAMRSTAIVMPTYLVVLTNPGFYLPLALKSIALGQQGSLLEMRNAGRDLLGATILGGILAVLFWWLLGLAVNLWMFFLWALAFLTFFSAKIYGVLKSRFSASFWQSVATTLVILLGAAVMDSENGKDVYQAFATRISLFLVVTAYAWLAVTFLEYMSSKKKAQSDELGSVSC